MFLEDLIHRMEGQPPASRYTYVAFGSWCVANPRVVAAVIFAVVVLDDDNEKEV